MKILVERGTHLLVVVADNFLPTSVSIFFLEYLLKDSQKHEVVPHILLFFVERHVVELSRLAFVFWSRAEFQKAE